MISLDTTFSITRKDKTLINTQSEGEDHNKKWSKLVVLR